MSQLRDLNTKESAIIFDLVYNEHVNIRKEVFLVPFFATSKRQHDLDLITESKNIVDCFMCSLFFAFIGSHADPFYSQL